MSALRCAKCGVASLHAECKDMTPAEVIATVIETHGDSIGTHWPECWKYHAVCLAVLLRDLGGEG